MMKNYTKRDENYYQPTIKSVEVHSEQIKK